MFICTEGIAFFRRHEDPEELRRRWAETRPQLIRVGYHNTHLKNSVGNCRKFK